MEALYGSNKTHHIAKCHGCIAAHIKILEQKDTEDLALGVIFHRRLGSELRLAGKYDASFRLLFWSVQASNPSPNIQGSTEKMKDPTRNRLAIKLDLNRQHAVEGTK